jgi:4'-phosphopantetheinyl transferase
MSGVDVWRLRVAARDDAHALVRSVLADYLDAAPEALTFVHGPHGKPELESVGRLRFNFTRSGSLGLLAVTRGRDVGVDVERIEPRRALGPIADRLFDAAEAAELRSMSEASRIRRFFELWTRKEAYAKALGVGLSVPLEWLRPPRGWSLVDLPLGPEHVGTLCVRGRRPRVRLLG